MEQQTTAMGIIVEEHITYRELYDYAQSIRLNGKMDRVINRQWQKCKTKQSREQNPSGVLAARENQIKASVSPPSVPGIGTEVHRSVACSSGGWLTGDSLDSLPSCAEICFKKPQWTHSIFPGIGFRTGLGWQSTFLYLCTRPQTQPKSSWLLP